MPSVCHFNLNIPTNVDVVVKKIYISLDPKHEIYKKKSKLNFHVITKFSHCNCNDYYGGNSS
jgi:hypothetical protein